MTKLLPFLNQLKSKKVWFRLEHIREETVMVQVAVPGERWEVEFFADDTVEIEVFRSDGKILDEAALAELWKPCA